MHKPWTGSVPEGVRSSSALQAERLSLITDPPFLLYYCTKQVTQNPHPLKNPPDVGWTGP